MTDKDESAIIRTPTAAAIGPPVPPVITADYQAVFNAERQFQVSYGRAVAAWSRVEGALAEWFARITGMPPQMARAIFFSGLGFRPRREMIEAAIKHASVHADELRLVKEAVRKARQYSEFRNSLVHGDPRPVFTINPTSVTIVIVNPEEHGPLDLSKYAISPVQMETAFQNFTKLWSYLTHSLGQSAPQHALTPQQALALVLALPNLAHEENAPTPSAPETPPAQPIHRNKKAFREAQKEAKKQDHP